MAATSGSQGRIVVCGGATIVTVDQLLHSGRANDPPTPCSCDQTVSCKKSVGPRETILSQCSDHHVLIIAHVYIIMTTWYSIELIYTIVIVIVINYRDHCIFRYTIAQLYLHCYSVSKKWHSVFQFTGPSVLPAVVELCSTCR